MRDEVVEFYQDVERHAAIARLRFAQNNRRNYGVLDPEWQNLRTSVDWAAALRPETDTLLRDLVWALFRYAVLRGYWQDVQRWLLDVIETCRRLDDQAGLITGFINLAYLDTSQGNYDDAIVWLQRGRSLSEKHDDTDGLITCYNNLGEVWRLRHDFESAQAILMQATQLCGKDQASDGRLSCIYNNLGLLYSDRGDYERAMTWYLRSLEIAQKQGDLGTQAMLHNNVDLVASLGVPFYKAEHIPSTFAIPTVKRRIVVKPSAPSTAFSPESTLDSSIYQEILRIIHETGIEMERHPSIYHGKDEETLRDHIIMVLSPHFQSVTGETFNKAGKTDILIRHEKANVFVAECKFWRGMKAFFETIDQVLGYLTWRDSKAAIVCFVRNKELNPVLQQIEVETSTHPCFVKYHGKKAEGWFSFEFHLKDDHTRSVQLAVLCFHFPR